MAILWPVLWAALAGTGSTTGSTTGSKTGSVAPPPRLVVSARVKTGVQPKSVSVSPDGRLVAVCNFGQAQDHNVVFLDPVDLHPVAVVDFPGTATESTWRSDHELLVSDFSRSVLITIAVDADADVANRVSASVVDTIRVGPNPKGIAVSADRTRAFVSNWSGRSVSVVDLVRRQVVQTIKTGRRPRGVTLASSSVVVGAMWDHRVEVFAHDDAGFERTPKTRRVCSYPRDVKTTPDGAWLVVSCSGNRRVRWFDAATRRFVGQAFVGPNPRSLSLASDGTWAAVANFHGSSVSMIDLLGQTATTTELPEVDGMVGIAVHPGRARVVYATSWRTGEVLRLVPARAAANGDPLGERRLRGR